MTIAASPDIETLAPVPGSPAREFAMRRGYVDTIGGQIHYRAMGRGAPIVLLHQAPGSSAMWDGLMPALAQLGYRCIAFDLPGYGMSDAFATVPEMADYARTISDAALALGLSSYDLVGHHTGSSVALWMATRGGTPIGRIVMYGLPYLDAAGASALANEPGPVYDETGAEVTGWWQRAALFLPAAHAARLLPRYTADMLMPGRDRAVAHHALGRGDHLAQLRALRVPVLAVQGRRDVLFEATRNAAQTSDWVEFREFGDAGIFVADECSEDFAQLVHDFLGQPE